MDKTLEPCKKALADSGFKMNEIEENEEKYLDALEKLGILHWAEYEEWWKE